MNALERTKTLQFALERLRKLRTLYEAIGRLVKGRYRNVPYRTVSYRIVPYRTDAKGTASHVEATGSLWAR